MNSPRVEYLAYRISGRADYTKAAPLENELDGFRIVADGEKAWLYPVTDYLSKAEAIAAAASLVATWEASASLEHGPGAFCLLFTGCKFEDPPPVPGLHYLSLDGVVTAAPVLGLPTLTQVHSRLPDVPAGMSFDDAAGKMLEMFNRAMLGKARWIDAGNYICSALHHFRESGERKKYEGASEALDVTTTQLWKLHALVSRHGDRKAGGGVPLTGEQEAYVRDCCRDLILKMAQLEGGSDPRELGKHCRPSHE